MRNNKEKGITLVALIITIIVMLILVGVSVQIVINSGLIGKAKDAADQTKLAYENEASYGDNLEINGSKYASLQDYENDIEILPEGAGKKVGETKTAYTIGNQTAQIPANFTVSGKYEEARIKTGLVIYYIDDMSADEIEAIDWDDEEVTEELRTTYDQFVWIPIDNANDMFMCQASTASGSCDIELDGNGQPYCKNHTGDSSKLMAGRLYATGTETGIGESFTVNLSIGTYTANSGLREPDIANNTTQADGKDENIQQLADILGTPTGEGINYEGYDTKENFKITLQNEYNAMVKSVIENKGFWVGRYETSNMEDENTNGLAKSETNFARTIRVIAGTIHGISAVNWYRMYAQQKVYAKNKNLIGGMISGAAYDQVMKFVNTLNYDVTKVGNVAHGTSQGLNNVYETGNTNYPDTATLPYKDISNNIYDLEGNVRERTIEVNR